MLARTTAGLAAARASLPQPVVLVPTMGALHDGHRALLRRAKEIARPNGAVVVSVFVNPLQFGAGEDLDRYPRMLERDLAVCGEEGAAVVFAPEAGQLYPSEQMITVNPGAIGRVFEGASRPGFFDGVLTVVLKLCHLVSPQAAVFGEKDAQQLALVRRMTAELDLGVEIAAVPTVRDPDGLAISSRNTYLSEAERHTALAIPKALLAARQVTKRECEAGRSAGGEPEAALAAARAVLDAAARLEPPLVTDYLALADPATFAEVGTGHTGQALLLAAATVGKTRLIDNASLTLGGRS
jgi:pantoate--beta-alanine ligase